jgi:CheY-like chemotaxis protein
MRRRILYIEDDPAALMLVRTFLERSLPDVLVDVCTTEAGAEERLNNFCYDLIISDYCLPGPTTGAVIAEHVLVRDPNQPFYLMSEYVGDHVKAEAARVGLELHGKFSTVEPDVFLSRVKALLEVRPCAEPAAIGESADPISSSHGRPSADSTRWAIADLGSDDVTR